MTAPEALREVLSLISVHSDVADDLVDNEVEAPLICAVRCYRKALKDIRIAVEAMLEVEEESE